jgi:hypothetical protein
MSEPARTISQPLFPWQFEKGDVIVKHYAIIRDDMTHIVGTVAKVTKGKEMTAIRFTNGNVLNYENTAKVCKGVQF